MQFRVVQEQSDLFILASKDLFDEASVILAQLRKEIECYTKLHQEFLTSLAPVEVQDWAPDIVKDMAQAGKYMNVGPMAAVAGAISENVARYLSQYSEEIIVENGGDDFIISKTPLLIGIYAGNSPFSMRIAIQIPAQPEGIAVCTSSGTIGHSLSFGNADAVTIIAHSGSIADATATAIGNLVKSDKDIDQAIDYARKFSEILGILIIVKDKIGAWGEIMELKSIG